MIIHPILRELERTFTIGFMDDIIIGSPKPLVASDVKHINTIDATIGLDLNFIKCEQINNSNALTSKPIGQFSHCTLSNATLLDAPFEPCPAMDSALGKKLDELKRACDRFQLISAHDALVLLRASCSASKLMHVIRPLPCAGHTLLSDIDNSLRLTLSIITNVNIIDEQWRQASLPVKTRGIGVRSVISIAPSAFSSSSTSTQQLQTQSTTHLFIWFSLGGRCQSCCYRFQLGCQSMRTPSTS